MVWFFFCDKKKIAFIEKKRSKFILIKTLKVLSLTPNYINCVVATISTPLAAFFFTDCQSFITSLHLNVVLHFEIVKKRKKKDV